MIPIIDIFAGPGGLSEGFQAVIRNGKPCFSVKLSVECENDPFRTLQLRSFFRLFEEEIPEDYYRFLRKEIDEETLYSMWPKQAEAVRNKTWQLVLGECDDRDLDERLNGIIGGNDNWVLLGGPPCQAYSTAGVVGNRTRKGYTLEMDPRSRLYREYIRILAVHKPKAFVFENVPGILTAKLEGNKIINDVLRGLANPGDFLHREFGEWPDSPRYRLISCKSGIQGYGGDPREFIVRAEECGIPQARHRVIVVGLREDTDPSLFTPLGSRGLVNLQSVIGDLPAIRSTLSREPDSPILWKDIYRDLISEEWMGEIKERGDVELYEVLIGLAEQIVTSSPLSTGSDFISGKVGPGLYAEWYLDHRLSGVVHHEGRAHIRSDFHRYLFCAVFGSLFGRSPKLDDFPTGLLPKHRNSNSGSFKDRFRVLLADRPSGTIISHLSKDGHAFIHPDPLQCRSLTPREAARIQTFPDNYYFFGSRTSKFRQIGNAVPPMLAYRIAESLLPVIA